MSQNQQARWLVAYDIAHPRRLGRVFRLLQKHGVPVQYSVFSVDTTPMKMVNKPRTMSPSSMVQPGKPPPPR